MSDAINPNHYKGFSNGAEVIDISENLVSNASHAFNYVVRAGRNDEHTKSQDVEGKIEDYDKAVWFINREIERLGGPSAEALEFVVKNMDDLLLRGIGITSDSAEMADKIIDRRNHPAYSNYELVLTFRKA